MDINEILNKTKKKSEQIKVVRQPPSIASTDRPYSAEDLPKETKITTTNPAKISVINNKQDTNWTKTEQKTKQKPTINWQQTDNKTGNKPTTNWQQTDNKLATNRQNWQQTDNKVATKPTTEVTTNWQQTDNKVATKMTFSMLVGLQRSCLLFIYKSCKANRNKNTEPLTLEHIAYSLKTSSGTIKTTLQRLEEKKYLIRLSFKNGRGGWSIYELPENIFTEMLRLETDNKLATNWQQTDNKVAAEPTTEPTTSLSSSSSYIYNKTTTTRELDLFKNLPVEWSSINIDSLSEIGFSEIHLVQIAQQGKLTPEVVQDSMDAFAFDLKYNNKAVTLKGSPLNYFMGIVRGGHPYAPPANYESPQERGLRMYLEKKRERENALVTMEDELLKLEFDEWERNLSEENKQALLPRDVHANRLQGAKRAFLRTYFINEIWPQRRKEIEKEISMKQSEKINPDF